MQTTITGKTENFFKNAYNSLQLSENRRLLLTTIAEKASEELAHGNSVNFNFICTHNSRRSQLCQVWAYFATHYFNLKNIQNFSGGTAVTAFYRNTVKTLQEVGFNFQLNEFSHKNPKYLINTTNIEEKLLVFSKLYDDPANEKPFFAITTCNNADENCPFIPDALFRFHLPFVDPKAHDNTDLQDQKYLETNKQIAGEMYFLFLTVSQLA